MRCLASLMAAVTAADRQGADVLDIGMVSTDQYIIPVPLSFAGMMVFTASHNPKAYNGSRWCAACLLLSGDAGIQISADWWRRKHSRTGAAWPGNSAGFSDAFLTKVLSIHDVSPSPLKVW